MPSVRRPRTALLPSALIAWAALAVAPTRPAVAQSGDGGAAAAPGAFGLGAGTAWESLGGGPSEIDLALQAGVERRLRRAPRVGVRLEGSYLRDQERYAIERWHILGAGLTGTLTLRRGRVQPYLLAGAGVAVLRYEYAGPLVSPFASAPTNPADLSGGFTTRTVSPTVSGGAGLLARVGPAWLFAETRLTGYARAHGDVGRGALPLVVGLRF